MHQLFQICGGSTTGADHLRVKKNNQDAFLWKAKEDLLIAVVADGCGSQPDSEVGSKIVSRLFAHKVLDHVFVNPSWSHESLLEQTRQDVLAHLRAFVIHLGSPFCDTLLNLFLSTLVGVIITKECTSIFSIGDGYYALNGEVVPLGPLPENAPPYMAYGLLNTRWNPKEIQFKIQRMIPTEEVQSILIGTDGIENLIENEKNFYPGKDTVIGPLSQFWKNDAFFQNPDRVRRTLTLMNKEETRIDWENKRVQKHRPLLPDDTTLIAIRRIKGV
jgi:hypothetical protein